MHPFVVHCQKGKYDVYVGRPSKWGNPFSHKTDSVAQYRVRTKKEAVDKFEQWFVTQFELVQQCREELRGKILGCWCEESPCHAEILAKIANR
jgi:hypothetical protein